MDCHYLYLCFPNLKKLLVVVILFKTRWNVQETGLFVTSATCKCWQGKHHLRRLPKPVVTWCLFYSASSTTSSTDPCDGSIHHTMLITWPKLRGSCRRKCSWTVRVFACDDICPLPICPVFVGLTAWDLVTGRLSSSHLSCQLVNKLNTSLTSRVIRGIYKVQSQCCL